MRQICSPECTGRQRSVEQGRVNAAEVETRRVTASITYSRLVVGAADVGAKPLARSHHDEVAVQFSLPSVIAGSDTPPSTAVIEPKPAATSLEEPKHSSAEWRNFAGDASPGEAAASLSPFRKSRRCRLQVAAHRDNSRDRVGLGLPPLHQFYLYRDGLLATNIWQLPNTVKFVPSGCLEVISLRSFAHAWRMELRAEDLELTGGANSGVQCRCPEFGGASVARARRAPWSSPGVAR